MPDGMSGMVLAERMPKRIPGAPRPAGDRLYRRSGPSERQRLQNANTMQSMDIMNKPYRRIELAERVRAALAKSPSRNLNDTASFRHEG
jgi:DNA-binding LytR/AlgR family response regulator